MKKGQLLSIDAMLSTLIFMVMIASVILLSNGIENDAVASEEFREMRNRLVDISDVLVTTRGNPEYWYLDSVDVPKSIGLAKRDRILSDDRLLAFNSTGNDDYETFRKVLGIGKFDLFVELLDSDGTGTCSSDVGTISTGKNPSDSNPKEKISIDRKIFTEDDKICTLRVMAWRD